MKAVGSHGSDLILRSPPKRSEGGRLEGWQLVTAVILVTHGVPRVALECILRCRTRDRLILGH